MSKYYKADDVIDTLADQWHFEATMEYPDTAGDIEEWKENARELYADLPAIEVSEDCISKDWLKTELEKWSLEEGRKDAWDNWNKAIETLLEIIDNTPSVTTEQSSMVGEWKNTIGGIYACSNCYSSFTNIPKDGYWKPMWNYCPHCGAKMKGAE